ncbi:MAG: response regulator [Balneolaceae bacterium]|nr:response regulator [Balneolaceae bacterium]
MSGSTISILLAQTPDVVHQAVSSLKIKGIEIETGFLRSYQDYQKAVKRHQWDILLINVDHTSLDHQKVMRSLQRRKAFTRVIAIGKSRSREQIHGLLDAGYRAFIPQQDEKLIQHTIRLQLEDAILDNRRRELEYELNYKSQFIAKISHEMRTTLNSVILLSEILAENRSQSLKEDEIEYIDLIHSSSNNLLDLLNKILDLSKIQSGKMDIRLEKVSVNEFCTRLTRLYIPVAAEKNIEFRYVNHLSDVHEINTDRIRLEQVLNNLISNAIKFTNKGHVKLTTYLPDQNELAMQNLDPEDSIIAFEISDTGIGINDQKRSIVFESYVQAEGQSTEKKYGGTGLGLAISKEIAHILGGKLTLESEYGSGSTFTVYLPSDSRKAVESKPEVEIVKVVQSEASKTSDDNQSGTKKSKGRVLLVDNSTIHNMALKEFLSVVVKECITAESAQEAYEILETDAHFDCIILDMYLPDAYGKDVLYHIRTMKDRTEVPVIIYSGKTISKTEQKELYTEALAVVQKNVNSYKVLMNHISDILNGKA